ncbi:MAG: GNAT family N-acetyltransferase [Clostridia bacterium]|nr:GNAT family N-acetyltransferase [Clostridia bacterium]
MEIIQVTAEHLDMVAPLVAAFRITLKGYKGIVSRPDVPAGREELAEYLATSFPVFAAMVDGTCAGYVVCRVDEPCVWVESIYTDPAFRRRQIGTALLREAEKVAASFGEETVFNYVHPNNHGMIAFLRRHGYTVLNLIEIRKPYQDEKLSHVIRVGEHEFDY